MAIDAVVTPTKQAVSVQKRGSAASRAAGPRRRALVLVVRARPGGGGPRAERWIGIVTPARTTARTTRAPRQPRRSLSTLVNGWNTKLDSPATSVTAVIARR